MKTYTVGFIGTKAEADLRLCKCVHDVSEGIETSPRGAFSLGTEQPGCMSQYVQPSAKNPPETSVESGRILVHEAFPFEEEGGEVILARPTAKSDDIIVMISTRAELHEDVAGTITIIGKDKSRVLTKGLGMVGKVRYEQVLAVFAPGGVCRVITTDGRRYAVGNDNGSLGIEEYFVPKKDSSSKQQPHQPSQDTPTHEHANPAERNGKGGQHPRREGSSPREEHSAPRWEQLRPYPVSLAVATLLEPAFAQAAKRAFAKK